MNGPNEIKNINNERFRQVVEDKRVKAESAKQQNHPLAEQFEKDYQDILTLQHEQ